MIAIIDNYDSFTYNLVHMVEEITSKMPYVVKNDEVDLLELSKYEHIILSPGPGIPDEAGHLKKVIEELGPTHKILGICLGLQAIGEVYGTTLKNLNDVFHGMRTLMYKTEYDSKIFKGVDDTFYAGRYHSWVIDRASDTSAFHITAKDNDGEIMAIDHKSFQVYGLQFHPESIMTDAGKAMVNNFLDL